MILAQSRIQTSHRPTGEVTAARKRRPPGRRDNTLHMGRMSTPMLKGASRVR